MDIIKNLLFIVPLILYYLVESIFFGAIINIIWRMMFQEKFEIVLTYWNWVAIVWVAKLLLFDIFKVNTNFRNEYEKIVTETKEEEK